MLQPRARLATARTNLFHSQPLRKARSYVLRACVLTFCLVWPTVLVGWGSIGHLPVAYVASQKLPPATKARVRDLIKLNPEYAAWDKQVPAGASADEHDQMIFMIAATWADD